MSLTSFAERERQEETNGSAALLDLTGHLQQRRTALRHATAVPHEYFPRCWPRVERRDIPQPAACNFTLSISSAFLFLLLLQFYSFLVAFVSSSCRCSFSGSFDASEMSTVEENGELSELSS